MSQWLKLLHLPITIGAGAWIVSSLSLVELSKLLVAVVMQAVLLMLPLTEAAISWGETTTEADSITAEELAGEAAAATELGAAGSAGGMLATELVELLDVAGGDGSSSS